MAAPTRSPAAAPAAAKKVKIRIQSTFAKVDGVPVTRGQIVEASEAEAKRLIDLHDYYLKPTGAGGLGGGNPYHGAVLADAKVEVPKNIAATDIPMDADFDTDE